MALSEEIDREGVLRRAATLLTHDDDLPENPVVPPIYQTSLFTFRELPGDGGRLCGDSRRLLYQPRRQSDRP